MTPDPYAPHLRQADEFFARGEIVKAGQIWQAILKQQPAHAEARERLLALRQQLLALKEAQAAEAQAPAADPAPAPRPEPAPEPAPEPMPGPVSAPLSDPPPPAVAPSLRPEAVPAEPDRLVIEGCTLYDMGQVGDALQKWEQVLALDPNHGLARSYANGARRELGLPPLEAPAPAPLVLDSPIAFGDDDVARLLREAVQLYDMGLAEEAIAKWERVLVLEPHRDEVREYLRQAREEVTQGADPAPPLAAAPASAAPNAARTTEALELKLRQADHLLSLQRHEEAAFTYQQALALAPGHPRALEGLARSRQPAPGAGPGAGLATHRTGPVRLDPAATLGRIAMVEPVESEGDAVAPPAALLQATPPPREGLSLPDRLQAATRSLPWLGNPKLLAAAGGGALVLVLGLAFLHGYQKDRELKEAVRAARAAAVAPVAQQAQVPDLAEAPAALLEEAESALGRDPLRAFLRAQAFVAQHPDDPKGPQLLEKARAGLPGGVTGASLPEFQKHLQNGDLEAAAKVMDALLRAQPDDGDLRARAARLQLLLCTAHAGQAKWEEAAEDLRRGRALYPGDKTWQARLRLLERVKALPKAQQGAWIPLLG